VQAQWRETTVGEHGEVILEGLPFEPGQPVDVLVIPSSGPAKTGEGTLKDSVLQYRDPFEPVAGEDWDATQ
jgi:hypothetical protein